MTEDEHTMQCEKPSPSTKTAGEASLHRTESLETAAFDGQHSGPPAAVSLPERFADYEVLGTIAQGGMGVVYRARQISLNRTVALKMIRSGEFASEAEVERFRSEAEAAAMLEHPHIVAIHEIGTQLGRQYFSMQLVEGVSLAVALRAGRFLTRERESSRRVAQLLATVARAVHYAHQHGILHRDLKPANILLDAQDRPFVTDFGLAKRVEGDSALTQSGAIVGTASYMSPEQAGAARNLTTATDVYGLGAILYETLTGRPPHRGDSVLDTLLLVRQQEPARPKALNPGVDRDLETICLKCLDKDPERRYGSAEALAEDLERWLSYEPIRARRSSVWERGAKWVRRRPGVASLVALLLLLSAVGFATVTLLWTDAAQARDAAEQAESDKEQQRQVAIAARGKAEEARDRADDAKKQEQEQRRKFQRLYIEQLLDKVANLGEKSEGARAALWLGRALQVVSPEDEDLNRILRTNLGEMRSQLAPLKAMLPHHKTVRVAAFSGDGKRVLTGGDDNTACLWDADTGKLLATLKHSHAVRTGAFSPDDRLIATGGNRSVQFWDADGKAVVARLGHPTWVTRLKFSPDGKKLLSLDDAHVVRLWNLEDVESAQKIGEMRNQLKTAGANQIYGMAFSPDSKLAATVGNGGFTQLWDANTAKPLGPSLAQHKGAVYAVQFRTNSEVVTGVARGLISYAVGKKQAPREITGVGEIRLLDYAPDRKLLATGGPDGNARLISGMDVIFTLGHKDSVTALAFSRDGKRFLTGSADQTARLWDTEMGFPLGMPYAFPCAVDTVACRADGKAILVQGPDKIVRLWNTPGPDAVRPPLPQGAGGVLAVAYSRDGKKVAAAISPTVPSVQVWDAETGELVGLNRGLEKALRSVAFHPDGQVLLTGGVDKTARLWDARTVKEIGKPCPHKAPVSLALFRPDGKVFVTIATNRTAQLWDSATQERVGKAMNSKQTIRAAAFSPDGKLLLTAGGETGLDGEGARLWDAATGEPLGDAWKHPDIVRTIAFSPDGRLACTAGDDHTVRLWDMQKNELRAELAHNGPVEAVAFSNDSKTLLTGSDDHTARLWDVASGKLRLPPIIHDRRVRAVAFSADDRLIATGCRDQAARIWDAGTGKLLCTPRRLKTEVRLVAFSPDGKTLQTSGIGSARCIRLWPVPSPLSGDVERLVLWTQVLTGMELTGEGVVNALDAKQWNQRRERLEKLGGPPLPPSVAPAAAQGPQTFPARERARRLAQIREGVQRTVRDLDMRLAQDKAVVSIRDLPNAAFFKLIAGDDPRAAEALLRRAFAAQDMDPKSPAYGALPWLLGSNDIQDENAIEFGTQALGPIWLGYGNRLSAGFRQEMLPHFAASFAALRRRQFRTPAYTNIFLMKAVNLILMGEAIGDPKAADDGYAELERWIAYTREAGIHEFDSSTYYGVDLSTLGLGYRYAQRPEARAKFKAILDLFWVDIAANCFCGRLAGPQSRTYDFLRGAGGLDVYLYAEGLRDHLTIGKLDLEKTYVLETLAGDHGYHPDGKLLALAGLEERVVQQRWDPQPGADRYHYLTPHFSMGSTSGHYGPQDMLLTVRLASAKDLPVISVIPDVFDEPYGKRRTKDRTGHNKPTHLSLNATAVQHEGTLLALLDLDASKAPATASLVTNVLLPAQADALVVDGEKVAANRPFERELPNDTVVGVREGRSGVAIRLLHADGCEGQPPVYRLKADEVGLKHGAARLVVYHYAGPEKKLHDKHLRVGILILAGRCEGEAQFAALLKQARAAVIEQAADLSAWKVSVRVGGRMLEAARDMKKGRPLYRRVDGREVTRPVLLVNGEDWATKLWASLP